MGKASREVPRGGIATYIGRRADLYRSTRRPILVGEATYIGSPSDQYRFIAPPSGDGVQTKFGGENKPSGETALYYSEAKLLYKKQSSYIIGAREGDGQAPRPPPPSEARLIAQGKARRLTLRAENWSIFVAEFYPPHLPPPFWR